MAGQSRNDRECAIRLSLGRQCASESSIERWIITCRINVICNNIISRGSHRIQSCHAIDWRWRLPHRPVPSAYHEQRERKQAQHEPRRGGFLFLDILVFQCIFRFHLRLVVLKVCKTNNQTTTIANGYNCDLGQLYDKEGLSLLRYHPVMCLRRKIEDIWHSMKNQKS